VKNEKLRSEIKNVIAQVEKMKADDECPLLVATALFAAYVQLQEALFRLATNKRSKDALHLNQKVKDL
jgi:hypothetical protein